MTHPPRLLILIVLAILAVPLAAMPFVTFQRVSATENRVLAPPPSWPGVLAEAEHLPRQVDAFLSDHFAFRPDALGLAARLERMAGVKTRPQAVAAVGKDDQLFLVDGLLRSTGQDMNPQRAADYAAYACEVTRRLTARGIGVVTTLAPSPASVIADKAPDWALPAKRPTDYDLIVQGLSTCGANAIDLRPAACADRSQPQRRHVPQVRQPLDRARRAGGLQPAGRGPWQT